MALFAVLCGCTKDEESTKLDIPSNIEIEVGENFNLNTNQNWTTTNRFVAEVDGSGKITANHVGECTIKCEKGQCVVSVKANYTLYREPFCYPELTKEYVVSIYGSNYTESGNIMMWETGQTSAPYVMYTFENGVFKGSSILVSKSYESSLKLHLRNRYVYVTYEDGMYEYIDAYSVEEMTKFVAYQSYNSSYYLVMYMPYTKESKKSLKTGCAELLNSIIGE